MRGHMGPGNSQRNLHKQLFHRSKKKRLKKKSYSRGTVHTIPYGKLGIMPPREWNAKTDFRKYSLERGKVPEQVFFVFSPSLFYCLPSYACLILCSMTLLSR